MRQYELIMIIQPDLDEEATTVVIDRIKNLIIDNDGEILKTELWGSRQLAYEIQDFREGYYVYMQIKIKPEYGAELRQSLRYIESIIRYMLTVKED